MDLTPDSRERRSLKRFVPHCSRQTSTTQVHMSRGTVTDRSGRPVSGICGLALAMVRHSGQNSQPSTEPVAVSEPSTLDVNTPLAELCPSVGRRTKQPPELADLVKRAHRDSTRALSSLNPPICSRGPSRSRIAISSFTTKSLPALH